MPGERMMKEPTMTKAETMSEATTASKDAAQTLASSRPFQLVARSGFAVNGLLHILIGAIAIGVALGKGGGQADQSGAMSDVAQTPGGVFVLWFIAIGLIALGLWQIVQLILVPAEDEKKKWSKRASDAGKAVAYIAVGISAFTFARGSSTNSTKSSQTLSAKLLSAPGGVFLLALIGVGVVAIGAFFVYRGFTRSFTKDIRVPAGSAGTAVKALGAAGYVAKGIALAIVGILFVVAAVTFDPQKATGLDGALKTLASLPFGVVILVLVGIGLIAYGLYMGARARLARL